MISNSENIGKTTDAIVYMWNQEHPKDMIIFASEPEPLPEVSISLPSCTTV